MATVTLDLKCDTSALREVMAELSPEEMKAVEAMIADGDDRWLFIGEPQPNENGTTLTFTVGLCRSAVQDRMEIRPKVEAAEDPATVADNEARN